MVNMFQISLFFGFYRLLCHSFVPIPSQVTLLKKIQGYRFSSAFYKTIKATNEMKMETEIEKYMKNYQDKESKKDQRKGKKAKKDQYIKHFSHSEELEDFEKINILSPQPHNKESSLLYQLAKTANQKRYCEYLENDNIKLVIVKGLAGTGKTMFACYRAIEMLKNKQIDKIVITRPLISVEDEEIGFLPGTMNRKMDVWIKPMMEYFIKAGGSANCKNWLNSNVIEILPLAYMRGRTFDKTFIIADEMQNSTPVQTKMLITRIGGEETKMVICGDVEQSDLEQGMKKNTKYSVIPSNGLVDLIEKIKAYEKNNMIMKIEQTQSPNSTYTCKNIEIVELDSQDIQRSTVVKKIMEIYNPTYLHTTNNWEYNINFIQ